MAGGWLLFLALPAAAAFEFTGSGAQSAALGGAFAAAVDAAETVWFNPAGNARGQGWQGKTTLALLYPGLADSPTLNGLAATGPLAGGGLQLGLSALHAEDWSEKVVVVGYGRPVHARLAVGGGLRSEGWSTTGLSHRSWRAALGAVYEVGWVRSRGYARLALVLDNLARANISAGRHAAGKTPRGLVLAASVELEEQQLLFDLERRSGQLEFRMGYETRTASLQGARFRLGGGTSPGRWEGKEVGVGLGHNWGPWQVDYAYVYPLRLSRLGGAHRLSVGYRRR